MLSTHTYIHLQSSWWMIVGEAERCCDKLQKYWKCLFFLERRNLAHVPNDTCNEFCPSSFWLRVVWLKSAYVSAEFSATAFYAEDSLCKLISNVRDFPFCLPDYAGDTSQKILSFSFNALRTSRLIVPCGDWRITHWKPETVFFWSCKQHETY